MSISASECPWRATLRTTALAVGLTLLWLVICFGIMQLAARHGCQVDEAASYPCVVLGIDVGGLLGFLGFLLVLFAFFWPLFALLVLACLGIALVQFLIGRYKRGRG